MTQSAKVAREAKNLHYLFTVMIIIGKTVSLQVRVQYRSQNPKRKTPMEVRKTARVSTQPRQPAQPKNSPSGEAFKVNHSADNLTFAAPAEAIFLVTLESQQINKQEKLPPPSLVADHECRS